jgi:CRP-like cAMP-binding protein
MNLGADDYLTKPFDDTDLLNAIEARMRKTSMQQKHYEASAEGLESFIQDARRTLNLTDLCKDKKIKSVKKKTEVFAEGDTPLYVYFLKTGHVKTYKANPDGKEFITNLYNAGDFFGFEPVLDNSPYQESAIAMQDSELIAIPKYDFLTMLETQRDVSASFITLLCKKVAEKEQQLLNLAYNSIRQRTAEAVLKVAKLHDAAKPIQISRDDLAKIVGTASESVIRVLSDFKDENLIEIDGGKIRIINQAKLEKVIRR